MELGWDEHINAAPTEELLNEAFQELLAMLGDLRAKLRDKPGLEFDAFIDALLARRAEIVHLGGPIASMPNRMPSGSDTTEHWSVRFNIDWSQYHPNARQLLDEPFYWDPANDESPHGANSRAAIVIDFRRWRQRHPQSPPWRFFLDSFRSVGILGVINAFRATDPAAYTEDDGLTAEAHDGMLIALAFALLKVDGACDPKVGNEALMALTRKQDVAVTTRLGWTVTAQERELAARLEAKLRPHV